MSADNGIYILPLKDGYYVAHCQNIGDLWRERDGLCYDPATVVGYFSLGRPSGIFSVAHFNGESEAWEFAHKRAHAMYDEGEILEYGVSMLDKQPHSMSEFKQMAADEANLEEHDSFHTFLDAVPNVPPMPGDELPPPESAYIEVDTLPNGCTLYRKDNGVGGHTYSSDEIGGGTMIWDTCLAAESSLIAAIYDQHKLRYAEAIRKDNEARQSRDSRG